MKVAHLILAHKNPNQLLRLLLALEHPAFDFYIHLDKKVDEAPFRSLLNGKNVFFINKRTKIYWGDYGTIRATIYGFEEILPKGYDYINVISGQDFPIKSADEIYSFFVDNDNKEFITCNIPDSEQWKNVSSRYQQYHLVNWRIPGKYRLEKLLTKMLPPRTFPLNYQVVGRANWFSLTKDAVTYCLTFLNNHPEVVRYFKYCWGADEFIFSTILYNSNFKEKLQENLVYVDWNGKDVGHPRVLDLEDFESLKASNKLFARKFDSEIDDRILSLLEHSINNRSAE